MSHRLFVAIKPPPDVIDMLIDTMEGVDNVRWQGEDQLHLTLRFIGEVDTPQANDIADALGSVRAGKFDLAIRGAGHFEKKGRPHTLWAGVAPSRALIQLQQSVESACRSAGIAPETRVFAPHVTLARLSGRAGDIAPFLAQHGALRSEPFTVERFFLVESTLSAKGAHYDPVVAYGLS
ncbi:RNA 2',3'-cyclic phosphodiesterase [Croceicoccus marinus]|uniref:RNA 2',3'-cyclic phosphodiesterase n=1 Tax=Croceicoccus marinus TaxID=450378 RepID=A0A1Z1F9V6_9SPHN|nr:RNA 2',3'-cyclic phosphodiesterase [Croceicoccus marinus]ARU15534.1 2'-5' RNA ligase [Croceicoccus marinus]